jgi:hypothetical protein
MAWEREKKYNPDDPKPLMTFEAGHTWETVLSRGLAERHGTRAGFRPDQLQEDGVWLSPDWINPEGDIQVEEWKATRKSTKSTEDKIREWGPQVMSYLRALLRRRYATTLAVRFRVWFIMGDWSFENKGDLTLLKDYYQIDVEYDKRDLEDNWRAVVASGQKYGLLRTPPADHGDTTWQRSKAAATRQKSDGKGLRPSSKTARVGTSQPTKRSSKPRGG